MIKVFKLVTGEEVITEVKDGSTGYDLVNPATIIIQQGVKGMSVGLAPFMPYSSGTIHLYFTAIVSEADAEEKMTTEYNRIFGSGIEVVPASALSGLKLS